MKENKHYKDTLKYFEDVASTQNGKYDSLEGLAMRIQKGVREAILSMVDVSGESIADVGCGRGDFSSVLAGIFPDKKITGIDFSEGMLEVARKSHTNDITFIQSSVTDIQADDRSFSSVVCLNTLHHLQPEDFPKAISELCRVAGRQVIVEIKNNISPYHIIKKVVVPKSIGANIYGSNILSVKKLFRQNGYVVNRTWSLWGATALASPIICVSAVRKAD